jgi:hypothetical protein
MHQNTARRRYLSHKQQHDTGNARCCPRARRSFRFAGSANTYFAPRCALPTIYQIRSGATVRRFYLAGGSTTTIYFTPNPSTVLSTYVHTIYGLSNVFFFLLRGQKGRIPRRGGGGGFHRPHYADAVDQTREKRIPCLVPFAAGCGVVLGRPLYLEHVHFLGFEFRRHASQPLAQQSPPQAIIVPTISGRELTASIFSRGYCRPMEVQVKAHTMSGACCDRGSHSVVWGRVLD